MVPAHSTWEVLGVGCVRLFGSSKMNCYPWSQIGVDLVEELEELQAGHFLKLEKILRELPYRRLLKKMEGLGFANVPSVPTCPATPSRLKCPETTHPEGSCSSHARTLRRGALATKEPVPGQRGAEKRSRSSQRG